MISTPISSGFSGLTASLLESLRDEFSKSKIFTTAMMENSDRWNRADTEVRTRCCYQTVTLTWSDHAAEVDKSTSDERSVEHDFARRIIVDAASDTSPYSLERWRSMVSLSSW